MQQIQDKHSLQKTKNKKKCYAEIITSWDRYIENSIYKKEAKISLDLIWDIAWGRIINIAD